MEKLRLGVIGTGSVVREIYQHLYFHSEFSHLLSIEAAADPNPAALAEFCDANRIPASRRFANAEKMIRDVQLDAAQINTPDSLHEEPAVMALTSGLDVLLPKPLSDTIRSAHTIIEAAKRAGRLLAVDFHKRDDPRFREAAARYHSGQYGRFQAAVFYMLDKLLVADPNYSPRYFASPNFTEKNSPISFLTVHMADALLMVIGEKPVGVRATGWSQKLPSLKPVPARGYDLCDVEIAFENGGLAHILTGWHLPNAAHASTVQSARIICTDGMLDLGLDTPGYHELTADGIAERNPLFRNFEPDGMVSGYGMSRPGRLLTKILRARQGNLTAEERAAMMMPLELGFWTTVILEAAHESLRRSQMSPAGTISGVPVDTRQLIRDRLGDAASAYM